MDELEEAKEDHIDLEYIHRLQVAAIDEIYENAAQTDTANHLIMRTLNSTNGAGRRPKSNRVDWTDTNSGGDF